jgi:hypothetical protein
MTELFNHALTTDEEKSTGKYYAVCGYCACSGNNRQILSNYQNILLLAELDDALVGQVIGYILERWIEMNQCLLYSMMYSNRQIV